MTSFCYELLIFVTNSIEDLTSNFLNNLDLCDSTVEFDIPSTEEIFF